MSSEYKYSQSSNEMNYVFYIRVRDKNVLIKIEEGKIAFSYIKLNGFLKEGESKSFLKHRH